MSYLVVREKDVFLILIKPILKVQIRRGIKLNNERVNYILFHYDKRIVCSNCNGKCKMNSDESGNFCTGFEPKDNNVCSKIGCKKRKRELYCGNNYNCLLYHEVKFRNTIDFSFSI